MKKDRLNDMSERDLLIGLIVDDRFCREIAPSVNPRLLKNEYSRIVSRWIKEYNERYKEAPKGDMLKIYRANCEEITDEALQRNILTFIESLNNQHNESFNTDFMVGQSIRYLKSLDIENLCESLSGSLITGDVDKAQALITKYRSVEKTSGETTSFLYDIDTVKEDIEDDEEDILFELPKAFGKVVGQIRRSDFISFLALPKHGKTWALLQCGMEAMRQGCKVLYVSLEMKRKEINRRLYSMLTGKPSRDINVNRSSFECDDEGRFNIIHNEEVIEGYSTFDVEKTIIKNRRMFHGGDMRVLDVPAYSLSVDMFDIQIEKMIQEIEFIPDVIIVDYADIMCPTEKGEYRNQIDVIWKKLRGMAQKRNCVLFTASQSNRSGVNKDLDTTNISEHFGKLAHITSFIAINQKDDERDKGIVRLKQLAVRGTESENTQAVCTQCLSCGMFVTDSRMRNEVNMYEDEEEDTANQRF